MDDHDHITSPEERFELAMAAVGAFSIEQTHPLDGRAIEGDELDPRSLMPHLQLSRPPLRLDPSPRPALSTALSGETAACPPTEPPFAFPDPTNNFNQLQAKK